ncbi:hypothetical protein E2C01_009818 [Portunus trituberculatus]|uniref:Uncharacterized protein n=1 Tax=Portunus trituberculatus TaxID=210409 RepID=A0A5B7D6S7_PORTR|nr:hypothetical protein [Portunus trituberculatus]
MIKHYKGEDSSCLEPPVGTLPVLHSNYKCCTTTTATTTTTTTTTHQYICPCFAMRRSQHRPKDCFLCSSRRLNNTVAKFSHLVNH